MKDASDHLDNPQTPARAKNKQLDVEQNRQTPRKADSTQRRNYQLPTKEFRKLVLKTMGVTIPELTLDHFFEGSVPEVPEKVVDATWKELQRMKREDGSSVIAAETGRWSWYERDPGNMSEDEDVVYKHMEGIWDAILDAAKKSWPGKKCTARLRCRPTFPSKSETQNSNFKTDGDVERLSNDEARQGTARQQKMAERKKPAEQKKIPSDRDRPDAYDSVVHLEFKKALTLEGANQNTEQIVGNAAQTMYADPCRRFRFGVTIENCETRFWFFSRTIAYVTEAFNFIKDPKPLIKFVLAISFASDEEMGYDPTVQRTKIKNEVVYDYQVTDSDGRVSWYRTKKCLCNYQSLRITGRAIRVWEVNVLDSKKKPVLDKQNKPLTAVLKDYWIPLDATRENETQARIKAAYKDNRGREVDEQRFFMTILHDIVVQVDGQSDTSHLYLRGGIPSNYYDFLLVQTALPSRTTKSSTMNGTNSELTNGTGGGFVEGAAGPCKFDQPQRVPRRVYELRKHCRLVFKEVGVRLDKISNQKVLLDCLMDATKGMLSPTTIPYFSCSPVYVALQYFYEAQWVHRDVSVGNLLMCPVPTEYDKRGFVCKITDLEYARPFQDKKPPGIEHDHKTGTPAYMAVEVQRNRYQFGKNMKAGLTNPGIDIGVSANDGDYTEDEDDVPQGPGALTTKVNSFPFFHNYLHDLEALWWIIMWNVFSTVPGDAQMSLEQYLDRNAHAEELFPPSVDGSAERYEFMINDMAFADHRNRLPEAFHNLVDSLGTTRDELCARYIIAETPPENVLKHKVYKGIHKLLRDRFRMAQHYAQEKVTYLDSMEELNQQMMKARQRKVDPEIRGEQPATGSKRRWQSIDAGDPFTPSGNSKKRPKSNHKPKPIPSSTPISSAPNHSTSAAGPSNTRRPTRSRKSSAGSLGPTRRNPSRKCKESGDSQPS